MSCFSVNAVTYGAQCSLAFGSRLVAVYMNSTARRTSFPHTLLIDFRFHRKLLSRVVMAICPTTPWRGNGVWLVESSPTLLGIYSPLPHAPFQLRLSAEALNSIFPSPSLDPQIQVFKREKIGFRPSTVSGPFVSELVQKFHTYSLSAMQTTYILHQLAYEALLCYGQSGQYIESLLRTCLCWRKEPDMFETHCESNYVMDQF